MFSSLPCIVEIFHVWNMVILHHSSETSPDISENYVLIKVKFSFSNFFWENVVFNQCTLYKLNKFVLWISCLLAHIRNLSDTCQGQLLGMCVETLPILVGWKLLCKFLFLFTWAELQQNCCPKLTCSEVSFSFNSSLALQNTSKLWHAGTGLSPDFGHVGIPATPLVFIVVPCILGWHQAELSNETGRLVLSLTAFTTHP